MAARTVAELGTIWPAYFDCIWIVFILGFRDENQRIAWATRADDFLPAASICITVINDVNLQEEMSWFSRWLWLVHASGLFGRTFLESTQKEKETSQNCPEQNKHVHKIHSATAFYYAYVRMKPGLLIQNHILCRAYGAHLSIARVPGAYAPGLGCFALWAVGSDP